MLRAIGRDNGQSLKVLNGEILLKSAFSRLNVETFGTAPRTPYSCGVSLLGLLAKITCGRTSGGKAMEPNVLKVPNTVRFLIPVERREEFTRAYFTKKVLKDLLKFDGRSILSVQDFPGRGWIDVTFPSQVAHLMGWKRIKAEKDAEVLKGVRYVISGDVPVVVHMFNPFVREEDILVFLRRHCLRVKDGVKIIDEDGFWTGKRKYFVVLKISDRGEELLPPHSFALGPDRGYLFFPGREGVCWSCGDRGHCKEQCSRIVCRHCGSPEHMAKECGKPRSCSLCGEVGHLFRGCPYRQEGWKSLMKPADQGPAPVRPPDQGQPRSSAGGTKRPMEGAGDGGRREKETAGARQSLSVCVSVSEVTGAEAAGGGLEREEVLRRKTGPTAAAVPLPGTSQEGRSSRGPEVEPGGLLPGWNEVLQKAADGGAKESKGGKEDKMDL